MATTNSASLNAYQRGRIPDWVYNFGGTSARYLRIQNIDKYTGTTPNNVGLGCVLIFEIPEPSTLALLGVGGLGLVVLAFRRRRRK